MGTDWLIKAQCPKPGEIVNSEKEHIKLCEDCPYVIWEKPDPIAGFMQSMCGVRVGSISMAAEIDDIGQRLTGIERFRKRESHATTKKDILERIRAYSLCNGWTIDGLLLHETRKHLENLIEFCKRAEAKNLNIKSSA